MILFLKNSTASIFKTMQIHWKKVIKHITDDPEIFFGSDEKYFTFNKTWLS